MGCSLGLRDAMEWASQDATNQPGFLSDPNPNAWVWTLSSHLGNPCAGDSLVDHLLASSASGGLPAPMFQAWELGVWGSLMEHCHVHAFPSCGCVVQDYFCRAVPWGKERRGVDSVWWEVVHDCVLQVGSMAMNSGHLDTLPVASCMFTRVQWVFPAIESSFAF